jgi:hypothetical protein
MPTTKALELDDRGGGDGGGDGGGGVSAGRWRWSDDILLYGRSISQ